MFCLKRCAGFAKIKIFFYHPGLDRHGVVDVSGDLDVPRAHARRRNPGVEFDSALRRLVLHEPSAGDPQIRSSASGFGLPGLFFQPHSLRTLDVSTPFSHRSTTRRFSPFLQSRTDLTFLTKDQRAKDQIDCSEFPLDTWRVRSAETCDVRSRDTSFGRGLYLSRRLRPMI
jgi:hypothetical protein